MRRSSKQPGASLLTFYPKSSAFLPPATLFDELSCTLREEEHLLEELPLVKLFSFLKDFLDFLCPDGRSYRTISFQ